MTGDSFVSFIAGVGVFLAFGSGGGGDRSMNPVPPNQSVQRMSAAGVRGNWVLGMALIADLYRSASAASELRLGGVTQRP
jgi:hypothetical protein